MLLVDFMISLPALMGTSFMDQGRFAPYQLTD